MIRPTSAFPFATNEKISSNGTVTASQGPRKSCKARNALVMGKMLSGEEAIPDS